MFDPKALLDRGWKAVGACQPEEACDLFAQAVAEARFLQNPLLLVDALMALGQTENSLRHPATAVDCYREAAAVAEGNGEPVRQAVALMEVAEILLGQQRPEQAAQVCEQLLAIPQKAENDAPRARARALHLLARLQEGTASPEELVLLWRAAAALYEVAQEHQLAAACQSHLAFLLGQ